MGAERWIAAEREARLKWEAASGQQRDVEARLADVGACRARAGRDVVEGEARATSAVNGDDHSLETAFSLPLARSRGERDRFAARATDLGKLLLVVTGEAARAERAWRTSLSDLWEPGCPGTYRAGILRIKAVDGEVCAGHRVSLTDADGGAFDFLLTGAGETPVERAVRGHLVGDVVTINAPGGAYDCLIVAIRA